MRRVGWFCTVALVAGAVFAGCARADGGSRMATAPAGAGPDGPPSAGPNTVSITARDYAFDVPAEIRGGLVRLELTNAGQEPHFAAFAKPAQGKTLADVRAALSAPPPSAPPPFEDYAGNATADGGARGAMELNLPAGQYVLYCQLPSADGVTHAAKGMMADVTVTEGTPAKLRDGLGPVIAVDFALSGAPRGLRPGENTVSIDNQGKQIHEINLIELGDGKTVDDVVSWFKTPAGPAPARMLSGAAIRPGEEATADFELEAGRRYAFICAIPDFLGDFAPHLTKGMYTLPFEVG